MFFMMSRMFASVISSPRSENLGLIIKYTGRSVRNSIINQKHQKQNTSKTIQNNPYLNVAAPMHRVSFTDTIQGLNIRITLIHNSKQQIFLIYCN